jgi:predicted CoA-binding protein
MNHDAYADDYIRGILNGVKTIAMVGASPINVRPSYFAFKYLAQRGYDMIPVNPGHVGKSLLGKPFVASLRDIDRPIDMVDIFESHHAGRRRGARIDAFAESDLDAAWRARRCCRDQSRSRRPQGRHEPLPQDRIWPAVFGNFMDGRQFANALLQASADADTGHAAFIEPHQRRRR